MAESASLTHLLPRARAEERAEVHYGGDASRILDISRAAVVCGSVAELKSSVDAARARSDVVRVQDRTLHPSPGGYRDLCLHIRHDNGFISTLRLLLSPLIEAKRRGLHLYEEMSEIEARPFRSSDGAAVVVLDMYNFQEQDGRFLIDGFEDLSQARDYARRRTRSSVEELRSHCGSIDELRWRWLIFGEDAVAVGEPGETYSAYADLEQLLATPASAEEQDWLACHEGWSLRRTAFDGPRADAT